MKAVCAIHPVEALQNPVQSTAETDLEALAALLPTLPPGARVALERLLQRGGDS